MIGIYKIENTVNGKVYIGQSINIEQRWKQHINHFKSGTHCGNHFQRSWDYYGASAFSFSVICECGECDLDELEEFYIKKYKSFDFRYGYNSTSGGKSPSHSEETKKKMRRPKPPRTVEHCKKLGVAHIGKTPWNKGLKMSPGVRAKQSEKMKGRKPHNCKIVICLDTGMEFHDSVSAGEYYGVIPTNIRKCCRGERPHAGGYHWKYKEE